MKRNRFERYGDRSSAVFGQEYYLSVIKNVTWRRQITKFRVSNHKLLIETGRHKNMNLSARTCPVCDLNEIEDESHFLLSCPKYATHRNKLMTVVIDNSLYFNNLSPEDQLIWLMSNQEKEIVLAITEFVVNSMMTRFPC